MQEVCLGFYHWPRYCLQRASHEIVYIYYCSCTVQSYIYSYYDTVWTSSVTPNRVEKTDKSDLLNLCSMQRRPVLHLDELPQALYLWARPGNRSPEKHLSRIRETVARVGLVKCWSCRIMVLGCFCNLGTHLKSGSSWCKILDILDSDSSKEKTSDPYILDSAILDILHSSYPGLSKFSKRNLRSARPGRLNSCVATSAASPRGVPRLRPPAPKKRNGNSDALLQVDLSNKVYLDLA